MWEELIKRIELQSVLVLFITLSAGYFLLNLDNTFTTPAGILGSVLICFGVLFTFGSFFSNQIRESYKDVITEYKSTISTLRTSHKEAQGYLKNLYGADNNPKQIGEYTVTSLTPRTEKE